MTHDKTYCDPEKHERHICALLNKGKFSEVEQLTDNPTVTCSICLVNANSPEHVCSPTTLGGGFRYSDMYSRKQNVFEGDTLDQTQEQEKKED